MASIMNALLNDYAEAGRLMLQLSTPENPFAVEFNVNGKKYVISVKEIVPAKTEAPASSNSDRTEVDAEVVE